MNVRGGGAPGLVVVLVRVVLVLVAHHFYRLLAACIGQCVVSKSTVAKMVRKLKHHEKKLLRKVDFINWEADNNLHEVKIMRRYHVQKREDYTM